MSNSRRKLDKLFLKYNQKVSKITFLPHFCHNLNNILMYSLTIRYSFIFYELLNIVNSKAGERDKTMSNIKTLFEYEIAERKKAMAKKHKLKKTKKVKEPKEQKGGKNE